jgi:tetratricopeptide (TPR) repeat protein
VIGAIVAAVILAVALGRGTTSHLRAQNARSAIHAAKYDETNALLLSAQQDYDAALYAKAEATLRCVLTLSEQPAVHDARKSALLQLGQVRAARGDLHSAEATWQEALSVLRENPESGLDTTHALNMLGNVRRQLGDLDGAETALTESEQIRLAKGDATGVVLCTRDRARVELSRGRAATARTLTEKAQALCRPLNKPDIEADLRGYVARAALAEGDLREARRLADGCLAYWKAKGHTRWIAELEQLVAEVALKQGRTDEARPLIEDCIRRMEAVQDRLGAADARLLLAHCALLTGDSTRAVVSAEKALETFRKSHALTKLKRAEKFLGRIEASRRSSQ